MIRNSKNVRNKTNLNNASGITLVMLSVIIVVMIILSGVAVVGISGDGGVFKKMTDMKGNMENELANTQGKIDALNAVNDVSNGTLEKAIITDATLIVPSDTITYDRATAYLTINKYDAKSLEGVKVVYKIGNDGMYYPADKDNSHTFLNLTKNTTYTVNAYEQYIDSNGNIAYNPIKSASFTTKDRPSIGTTISYTHPGNSTTISGTYCGYYLIKSKYNTSQTFSGSNEKLKLYSWKILSIDGSTVELISDAATSYVNKNYCYIHMQGARGFNNCVKIYNDICSTLYSNSSKGITARSMNLDDIRKYLKPEKLAQLESGQRVDGGSYYYYGFGQTWPTAFSGTYLSVMAQDENVTINGTKGTLRSDQQNSYVSDSNNGVSSSNATFWVKKNTWGDIFPYGYSKMEEYISLSASDFKTNPDTGESYYYLLKPSYNDTNNQPALATRGYALRKKIDGSKDYSLSCMFMFFYVTGDSMRVGGAVAKTFRANSDGSGEIDSPTSDAYGHQFTFRPIIKVDISRIQKSGSSWVIN